jgi:hypothetical protein
VTEFQKEKIRLELWNMIHLGGKQSTDYETPVPELMVQANAAMEQALQNILEVVEDGRP